MKQKIFFALIMGFITTGIISFALIVFNIGITPAFWGSWIKSWTIAYTLAVPVILLVGPKVQALVNRLCKEGIILTERD